MKVQAKRTFKNYYYFRHQKENKKSGQDLHENFLTPNTNMQQVLQAPILKASPPTLLLPVFQKISQPKSQQSSKVVNEHSGDSQNCLSGLTSGPFLAI